MQAEPDIQIYGESAHVFGRTGVWCDCSGNGTLTLRLIGDMVPDIQYVISFNVVNGPLAQDGTDVTIKVPECVYLRMYGCVYLRMHGCVYLRMYGWHQCNHQGT